jgi:MFS family permease
LISLLTLGSLSDRHGFVRVLRWGLIIVTTGSLLSALA